MGCTAQNGSVFGKNQKKKKRQTIKQVKGLKLGLRIRVQTKFDYSLPRTSSYCIVLIIHNCHVPNIEINSYS